APSTILPLLRNPRLVAIVFPPQVVLPFFFPATLILRFAGPEEAKNLAGRCPPPDSDPFNGAEFGQNTPASQDNSRRGSNGRLRFNKRTQLFIRVHNKRFPLSRCSIRNPDRSPPWR